MIRVAILGCGPAGLIAAHTAELMGADVVIASIKNKSIISGAQVLHERVPECTPYRDKLIVNYYKLGTREQYSEKVYGDSEAECSWPLYQAGPMECYSQQGTYDKLWEKWEPRIENRKLDFGYVCDIAAANDFTFSTVPLPQIVDSYHHDTFIEQEVWTHQFPPLEYSSERGSWIEYTGLSSHPWYRRSFIKGVSSYEFSYETPLRWEGAEVRRISKPLDVVGGDKVRKEITPPGVILVGRYGEWRKGRLVHHAMETVKSALDSHAVH